MTVYVLDSARPSHWQSLNEIYPCVRQALRRAGLDLVWVDVDSASSLSCGPGDSIFVLNAQASLEHLLKDCSPLASIYLPIYGDMTIEHQRWISFDKSLLGRRILFLAASARSAEQIKVLVKDPVVALLPYPVADEFFETKSAATRAKSMIYAGRITSQKNILVLMEIFLATQAWGESGVLEIAGQFHDRGYHFHSRLVDHAAFVRRFGELVAASKGSIIYHGNLSQAELRGVFAKTSQILSLSTYHDEDYGLSVAQAMAMGCAPILSSWGGHGFFLQSPLAQAVGIDVDEFAIPHPNLKSVTKALLTPAPSQQTAQQIRDWAKNEFSVAAVAKRLSSILATSGAPYLGQSALFHEFCSSYERGRTIPFHHKDAGFRDLYLRIYSSYLGVSSVEVR